MLSDGLSIQVVRHLGEGPTPYGETLVGDHLLGNLCKGLVASLYNHASVVWYDA
jgi:hypothetical protein